MAAAVAAGTLAVPAASGASPRPVGRYLLQTRGLWTCFEHRGAQTGYHAGELLEAIGGPAARNDVVAQLKQMRAMGVNELAYELRSADGPWPVQSDYPACQRSTALGPQWPQPTGLQLAGLKTLFGLAHEYGMRIMLILNTTHMEEQPADGNARWLAAIVNAVKDQPALDLVVFGGDRHAIDAQPPYDGVPDSCGGESEAPLWLGPDSIQGRYIQWALGYAHSLGVPSEKLSAEAIVGDYRHEARQGAGPDAESGHLWRPVEVLRTIYDRLGVPPGQRTYALSYYAHRRCTFVESWLSCSDVDQLAWTRETLQTTKARVEPQARTTMIEFGFGSSSWTPQQTVAAIGALMQETGIEGGTYWKWADETNDPKWTDPGAVVKQRGLGFVYNPQQRELTDLYGFHLTAIPNGSFEDGTTSWTPAGEGTAVQTSLDEDAPWRGRSFLRLTATGAYSLTGPPIRVSGSTRYTTAANLRGRGTVFFRYSTCTSRPTKRHTFDSFRIASPGVFGTVPFVYTTPPDACFVRIQMVPSGAGVLDVDAVR